LNRIEIFEGIGGLSLMSETKEELKQQLSVLTARRDRMQKNLYEVEKEISEINSKLAKMK
jgi:chromosome segregation ATPase